MHITASIEDPDIIQRIRGPIERLDGARSRSKDARAPPGIQSDPSDQATNPVNAVTGRFSGTAAGSCVPGLQSGRVSGCSPRKQPPVQPLISHPNRAMPPRSNKLAADLGGVRTSGRALVQPNVLGPAGFRFSDYWQLGLPSALVVAAVRVPMRLLVWRL